MSREFPDSLQPNQVNQPEEGTLAVAPGESTSAAGASFGNTANTPHDTIMPLDDAIELPSTAILPLDDAIELTPDAIIESPVPVGKGTFAPGTFAEGEAEPWSPPAPLASGAEPPVPPVPPVSGDAAAGDPADDADHTQPMTLTEHLGELRVRLVRVLIGAGLGFLLCYGVSEQLFMWLAQPLAAVMPADTKLIYTSVPEGFFVYLKVAFVAGVFVASPYIFYQVWAFIAPGLYREERQQVLPLALFSAFFFVLGASFCYFLVFPYAFTFFMSYSTGMIVAMPSINEYLSFSLKMILAFGLIFEMPLFAFFLARMGLITAGWMRRVRRYAVLVVFVVAAILTPPDVFSQMLMAVPMLVLYEISIYVAAAVGRKEKPTPDPAKGAQA